MCGFLYIVLKKFSISHFPGEVLSGLPSDEQVGIKPQDTTSVWAHLPEVAMLHNSQFQYDRGC